MQNKKLLVAFILCLSSLWGQAQYRYALDQLNLQLMTTGFGNVKANKSCDGNPLTLNGKVYEKGVGTHATSKLIIALHGKGKAFSATVGVDDEATERGSVLFKVIGDGKILNQTPLLRRGEKPRSIHVNLKGIDTLRLEALPGPDGNNNDHADWADAWIEMKEGKPTAIPECQMINIGTKRTLLTLSVDKNGNMFQQYYGPKGDLGLIFKDGESRKQAYPTIQSNSDFSYWGAPALHVIHSDGHTSTMLKYQGHETTALDENISLTRVKLKDPNYLFSVDICYKTYIKEDMIEQWTEIQNDEEGPVLIKDIASASLSFNNDQYWLTQFTGAWANEFNVNEYQLTKGEKVLENRWGITSSNERQQHFMLSLGGKATETRGNVIAGSLKWSGNWRLNFDMETNGELTVLAGTNPWSGDYSLETGKKFISPALLYTYSSEGKGQASRNFHHWALKYGIRDGKTLLRTIFNNWEATGMNTADNTIIPFLAPAHDLGFELFLLDDGWFGLTNKARVLGEWDPTPIMHPNGMKTIIEAAGKTEIDFGLWVEMEMANPEARLVKEHPEWLLCEPNRKPYLQRGQYVLDLTNPAVQDFCIESFQKIITNNPGISFVKWDCNSPFHNPYSHYLGKKQQHLWYDYTQGLYHIFREVMQMNPKLQMMLCSAGGARNDYGALQYFHEFWTSDNTNPLSRVYIQWGTSHIFPAKVIGAHVTHMGNQPFKFAFDVAMSGCLGMDADPTKMSKKEKEITKRAVEVYKTKIRPIVQLGDLYRLVSPYETSRSVMSYVESNKEKAVLFVYQVKDDDVRLSVKMQGLDSNALYNIEEVNIGSITEAACMRNGQAVTGKELMEKGIMFHCHKRFDSSVIYLTKK